MIMSDVEPQKVKRYLFFTRVRFNISGNYSGGFLIAYGRGEKCTAPCLQGGSKEFVLIGCVLRKRSVFILYFTHPHLFNENKLLTHTKQGAVLSRCSIALAM